MSLNEQFEAGILTCPFCNGNNLHMPRVGLGTGEGYTEFTKEGSSFSYVLPNYPKVTRGTVLLLTVKCEMCQQASDIIFRFHKGQIITEVNKSKIEEWDIWRD